MLSKLSIHNYRSFKDFQIDGLAQVNLIVGSNNSGKTSLLEAVYLLANQNNPQCLLELLDNRGEIALLKGSTLSINGKLTPRSYQIKHIFPNHQLNFEQGIDILSSNDRPLSLHIQLSPITLQAEPLEDISETDIPEYELHFIYQQHQPIRVPVLEDGLVETRFFKLAKSSRFSLVPTTQHCQFLTTDNIRFSKLAEIWDGITLTPKEDEVVRALQIIEPDVERISFTSRQTSNSGIIIKLSKQNEPIPLGSMGDGMRRILTLAMSAVNVENGFLLVDEIDTGLYYEVQADMWRLILEIAKRLNIQVFATTHSWDCVRAFQEALNYVEDSDAGKLFRLDAKYGKIRAVEYVAEELNIAVQQNIEVR
ncbi:AAA family ATPase [Scytonema sp. UIC 10036]|uniref:AAA family ATPase n=1 Tax=Scytonema sp. UIC 10036 TaxID=2304196 RepID=UPI0012DAE2BD|nr:ATP-binding protein [Scytonema sp. UIC 10036]MUG98948.1 AAA family ATPase [Scytonema sp. UIC 10036]